MVRRLLAGLIAGAALSLLLLPAGGTAAATPATFHAEELTFAVVRDGLPYEVRIEFLVAGDDPGAAAAVREAYRARFETAGPTAGTVSAAYALDGYAWPDHAAAWGYNPAGKPATLVGELDLLRASAETWGRGGADFAFTVGGAVDLGTGGCHGDTDGSNTVGWASQPGTVLGVTCAWSLGGVATEFDMELDPEWDWTTSSASPMVDLQSVVTHELGHALGLGHSESRGAVMDAVYRLGTVARDLTPDDRSALVALYGAAGPSVAAPLSLAQGANLVTWAGPDAAAGEAFAPVAGSVVVVYGYDAASGAWTRYLPGLPAYVSNLDHVRAGDAFWVIARSPATLPMLPY